MKRIGILTGGGDAPGLNSAIKWVTKAASSIKFPGTGEDIEVIGIKDGWKGLVECDPNKIVEPYLPMQTGQYLSVLETGMIRTWDRQGGTMLGTSRTNPFDENNDQHRTVLENLERIGIKCLVAIGGEDTLGVAAKFWGLGVPVIAIPKTIDKDLWGTDYTLGFETAVNIITEEIDRLRTTAGSHKRVFVVETMGRHAGHLALQGGMSAGAPIILIPEHDFSSDRVCELLENRYSRGRRYSIVVVSEGAKETGKEQVYRNHKEDQFKHLTLGGIGEQLAKTITEKTGLETRSMVLSHLQRGGTPSAYDRRMGRNFGISAMNLLEHKQFGRMVCFQGGEIKSTIIEKAVGRLNLVNVAKEYDTEFYNGKWNILFEE